MTIEERNKIVLDNEHLIHNLIKKYYKRNRYDHELHKDLFQDCCLYLMTRLDRFDPSKSELSTFIGLCVQNAIYMYIRKNKNKPKMVSENRESFIDDFILADSKKCADVINPIEEYSKAEILEWFKSKVWAKGLDKFSVKVFLEYYSDDEPTMADLAKKHKTPQSTVCRKINYVRDIVRELAKKKFEYEEREDVDKKSK